MTGEQIRDIGYLAWENKSSWLESMKGKPWKNNLRQERSYWNALTRSPRVKQLAKTFHREFKEGVEPNLEVEDVEIQGVIILSMQRSGSFVWRWKWESKEHEAHAIDTDGTHVWYTQTDPKNKYRYIMTCKNIDGKILWRKYDASVEVCVVGDLCYYIKLEYPFNTLGIYACNAYTGKDDTRVLVDADSRRFITLVQGANRSLFCNSGTWSESKLWLIKGTKAIRKHAGTKFQMPLDEENTVCTLQDNTTEFYGPILKSWIMPPKSNSIQWINTKTGHIVTINEGEQTIWYCAPNEKAKIVFHMIAGEIQPPILARWYGEVQQNFIIRSPIHSPQMIHVLGPHIIPVVNQCISIPNTALTAFNLPELTVSRYSTKSADGTRVSYAIVNAKASPKPKKLLAYVYGAYGSQTIVSWPHMHWAPLFSRGWAVAYSYPRGAGDRDIAWMMNGQAKNHIRTIEDFEAVVRHAQGELNIPPKRTVIYGRSAGGLMVGGTTARNPDGKLMGATYTEVPFVDALRSQTNPAIPLVESGYSEYGDPIRSAVNFKALLDISPINALPSDGAPGVFVICRTGLKDLQVMPFEPIKWIRKLRGTAMPPAGKFLAYEEDEAHVYSYARYYTARALDLAILDLWADGRLQIPASSYTRKNRSTLYTMAQQKKQQQKQQQKKQQEGGKRRTRRSKKSRRGTRKARK
jgi:pimeloyl-ACP methyl ester carboxylesterase